jgi:ribosome-binding protein aMBF1 (putative translation factor)
MAKLVPPKPRKLPDRYPVRSASPVLKTLFNAMHNRGITVEQMAASIKRPPSTVTQWRTGKASPRIVDVEEIAHTLGFEITLIKDVKR